MQWGHVLGGSFLPKALWGRPMHLMRDIRIHKKGAPAPTFLVFRGGRDEARWRWASEPGGTPD